MGLQPMGKVVAAPAVDLPRTQVATATPVATGTCSVTATVRIESSPRARLTTIKEAGP